MRESSKQRKTKETDILLNLNIDGEGIADIKTGIGFFDHMMELFTKQSGFNVELKASGDLQVDMHHSVEDTGLVLGDAFTEALGDKKNIQRYASATVPMDEVLVMVAVDISGRPFLAYDIDLPREEINGFDVDLVNDFLQAFVSKANITLHLRLLAGRNTHHIVEATFKALGLVLRQACAQTSKGIPSTKGIL